jgi:hypothetical protein
MNRVNHKSLILFIFLTPIILAGCYNPLALIESATTKIEFTMVDNACRDEKWVVPAGEKISLILTNPRAVPQIFIIMARAATPPFDIQDQDRIYTSVPVPPGTTITSFTSPAMPAEYQVICGPADNLEPLARNVLVVVDPGVK